MDVKRFDNTGTPYPLGRHVEHDERSRAYAAAPRLALPQGKSTYWHSYCYVLNQGELGSCTGNALAQWMNTNFANPLRLRLRQGKAFKEDDAIGIYSLATHLDEHDGAYPPDDTGSSGLGVCKAAVKMGLLDSYAWVFSWTSLQATIEKTPLLAGTVWTNNMFYPVNGLVSVGSLRDSNISGGHEYLVTGIDYRAKLIECRNCWGDTRDWPGCKPGGYFAVTFTDFRRLQDMQGDFVVPHMKVA